jgi:hypothetical protein
MKSQPERQLEQQCRRYARQQGLIMCKLEKNGHKGIPDDIILTDDGRFWLVEFKNGALGRLSDEQRVYERRLSNCLSVIRYFADFQTLIDTILKENQSR